MSKEPSEILAALYLLYKDHFRNLQNAGYSHKEGFWLSFACLPFLPWDERAEDEIRLSQVLRLYSGIYQYYVDATIKAEKEMAFIELLKERYQMVQDIVSRADPSRLELELGRFILPDRNDPLEWKRGGLVVLNTKLEWERQQPQDPIPCKLIRDI